MGDLLQAWLVRPRGDHRGAVHLHNGMGVAHRGWLDTNHVLIVLECRGYAVSGNLWEIFEGDPRIVTCKSCRQLLIYYAGFTADEFEWEAS